MLTDGTLKTWSISGRVFDMFRDYRAELTDDFETTLFKVKRRGAGKETKYSVLPLRQLTEAELTIRKAFASPDSVPEDVPF